MGKQRRQRTSFHISPSKSNAKATSNNQEEERLDESMDSLNTAPLNFTVSDNLFANLNINSTLLKQSLKDDDTKSVKSNKSAKSEAKSTASNNEKTLNKKDKLKLRRNMLLQKIDLVNQKKKEAKLRKKRKHVSVIGDTNPLHDALPSLESLMTRSEKMPIAKPKSTKGMQKAIKRKKEAIKNIQLYKTISKNKEFNKNPMVAITQHIKAIVEEERLKSKQTN